VLWFTVEKPHVNEAAVLQEQQVNTCNGGKYSTIGQALEISPSPNKTAIDTNTTVTMLRGNGAEHIFFSLSKV